MARRLSKHFSRWVNSVIIVFVGYLNQNSGEAPESIALAAEGIAKLSNIDP